MQERQAKEKRSGAIKIQKGLLEIVQSLRKGKVGRKMVKMVTKS